MGIPKLNSVEELEVLIRSGRVEARRVTRPYVYDQDAVPYVSPEGRFPTDLPKEANDEE